MEHADVRAGHDSTSEAVTQHATFSNAANRRPKYCGPGWAAPLLEACPGKFSKKAMDAHDLRQAPLPCNRLSVTQQKTCAAVMLEPRLLQSAQTHKEQSYLKHADGNTGRDMDSCVSLTTEVDHSGVAGSQLKSSALLKTKLHIAGSNLADAEQEASTLLSK